MENGLEIAAKLCHGLGCFGDPLFCVVIKVLGKEFSE